MALAVSGSPSLYRRHRPRSFADVVGQEHVVRTLRNAVQGGQVHHAYLFVGSRGTGKTSMAKILAACLNCQNGPTVDPCGTCDSCQSIAGATSLDVIEMDAASNNSVDDIRELREKVAYAPVSGRHKVYILDEAHMLSSQAWNAFLKTLEEPPPRTVFVLATTEAQKVLPTVVDRCHRFDFGRPSVAEVAQVLGRVAGQEGISIDSGALGLVARHATGSFRDALGTLEQLLTYSGQRQIEVADVLAVLGIADGEQLFDAVDAVIAGDPAAALRAAARLAESGRDAGQVLKDLETHGRELFTVQLLGEVTPDIQLSPERDRRLLEQAQALTGNDAVRLLDLVSEALEATGNGGQARIQLELALVKAAAPQMDPSRKALLSRIERLEQQLGAGVSVAALPPTATAIPQPAATATPQPAATATPQPAATATPQPPPATPASPPQDQADPADPEPDLPTVAWALEIWPAVVDGVRDENIMLATLLSGARPVSVQDHELTLAFPSEASFFKRKAEQEDHRRIALETVRAVTGVSLSLSFILADPEPSAAAPNPGEGLPGPAAAANGHGSGRGVFQALSGDELVQRLKDELDAEEVPEPTTPAT